jgi:hypothetical protein
MKTVTNYLNRNYYFLLTILILFLNLISFLSLKGHIHPFFKHISFISLLSIALYMFPLQAINSPNRNEIISKFVYCVSIVYMALSVFLSFEKFEILGKILITIFGIFTFYLLFIKTPESKLMFKSHFILNNIMLGVIILFFFK